MSKVVGKLPAVLLVLVAASSRGQEGFTGKGGPDCGLYDAAVFSTPGSVPDPLLDSPIATVCLMGALTQLSIRAPGGQLTPDDEAALVRVSGALGKLIDRFGTKAIEQMREADSLGVIDLLSYGATNPNTDTRLNSTALLSNIIDNSTVCVAMDHLADPALAGTDYGIKGRANLLASVSVVAPWATKSNYANMEALSAFVGEQLQAGTMLKTQDLLKNFNDRLQYQDSLANPNKEHENSDLLSSCQSYQPKWAVGGAFQLSYPAQ